MLPNLLMSAVGTSTRRFFAKSNACVPFVSSHRTISGQKDLTSRYKLKIFWAMGAASGFTTFFWTGIGYWLFLPDKECDTMYRFEMTEEDFVEWKRMKELNQLANGINESVTNPHPIDRARVWFTITHPTVWSWYNGTHINYRSEASIHLPNCSLTSDYIEICDWLGNLGIQVEKSESGARVGLIEFLGQEMYEGNKKHFEKKCYGCAALETQPKTKPEAEPEMHLKSNSYWFRLPWSSAA